jgi:hypothetical protein
MGLRSVFMRALKPSVTIGGQKTSRPEQPLGLAGWERRKPCASYAMKMLLVWAAVTLAVAPGTAAAQSGTAPFCIQTAAGARCVFATMADCERMARATSAQCITRADAHGTTGLGESPARSPGLPTDPSVTDR